ncbi:unnamed protein product [Diamesa tonsa]
MSRWNKSNRFAQTIAVPLQNLEKENKNSVAVLASSGRWGQMGFTSIRSSCYNMGALASTSPIQNTSSPSPSTPNDMNDKITVDQVPKPRKFFKSRNAAPPIASPEQQQIQYQLAQQQLQHQQQQAHFQQSQSSGEEDEEIPKSKKKKIVIRKPKEKVEKTKPAKVEKALKLEKPSKPEKMVKPKKEKKAKEKLLSQSSQEDEKDNEDVNESETPKRGSKNIAEPSRSSGRARNKFVNYNDDAGEDEFYQKIDRRILPLNVIANEAMLGEQQVEMISEPSLTQLSALKNEHPPIVLRISKGTSRLISTDNEEAIKSPVHDLVNETISEQLGSTDELIAILSNDSPALNSPEITPNNTKKSPAPVTVARSDRLKIKIKSGYIRSYNDSLENNNQTEPMVLPPLVVFDNVPESTGRMTRNRRNKLPQKPEIIVVPTTRSLRTANVTPPKVSPLVSDDKEFDSQSSVLGSVFSQKTTSTVTTNNNSLFLRDDSRVIHSRGSSVVTSDVEGTSQQSSMAAAPPSDINLAIGSENNSTNTCELGSIELQLPPVHAVEEAVGAIKGKRGRKKAVFVVLTPVESTSEEIMEKIQERTSGRVTRNTKNTAVSQEISSVDITSPALAPVFKSYSRKRKIQKADEIKEEDIKEKNLVDDSSSMAINLSQKSTITLESSINQQTQNSEPISHASTSSLISSPVAPKQQPALVPEYKHKKLVKRPWMDQPEINLDDAMEANPVNPLLAVKSPFKHSIMNNKHLLKQQDIPIEASDVPAPIISKLVISKKKGSIFKSRALVKDDDNNKKRQHLYKHKWEDDEEINEPIDATKKPDNPSTATQSSSSGNQSYYEEFDGESSGLVRFTKHQKTDHVVTDRIVDEFDDEPVTGLKCDRNAKKYYQVVRNVKKAHQIQEIGEFQEMDDDVEYLLDALQPNIQVATRCLSALQLASKCMTPSFRMHVRAHGIVPKFFKALGDAPNDPCLGLCTAMVMFVLSQDTLNMDLDRDSLELMLNLLECDGEHKQLLKDSATNKQQLEKKQKVRELCEEIQSQGKSIHFNLDNITVSQLAMETLLSLTSKRAGEWFKEELRELGGIEHIMKTVCECCQQITDYVQEWTEPLLEKLNKIERCLRVLENVTQLNEENQKYILHYKSQMFVKTLCRFYHLLDTELTLYPTNDKTPKDSAGVAIREALVPILKVIINLTHPFNERAIGSVYFGDQKEIFYISFHLMLFGSNYVPVRIQFELSVLSLVLLNNLSQFNEKNRQTIMQLVVPLVEFGKEKQPAVKALVEYFYKCEDKARMIKKITDDIFDNPKDRDTKQKSQEETVTALIQKAGNHMEHTILGSIASLLVGFLITSHRNNEIEVRRHLRNGEFSEMVGTLEKYYEFMNLTVSSEASSLAQLKTIKNVIDYLRKCDAQ